MHLQGMWTDGQTDRQADSYIPQNFVCRILLKEATLVVLLISLKHRIPTTL